MGQGEDPLASNPVTSRQPDSMFRRSTRPGHNKPQDDNRMRELSVVLAKGIALGQYPISITESDLVKSLVRFFGPSCVEPSRDSSEDSLMRVYYQLAHDVKQIFLKDVAVGSFTADTWSSKGNRKFLGLTFHYLQPDFTPRSVEIGFVPLEPSHRRNSPRCDAENF
ncbi:hypothetical protein BC939DRAFT_443745 [Gamsiella multidivaricata]|uniref:uncharacterized protein n=1 Tax=Gamsiella multidivaricata TaxID=101098 RepID=UPI00221E63B9|nr:uncharacterized protein BC939DRAFT_443745 [Gamsiella multidivaricata]KAI7828156.1 hypothetical protein BC939DRAFT_443745 [Gamsiella multidivaricata]